MVQLLMRAQPPIVRFDTHTFERRDMDGMSHSYDRAVVLVTAPGTKDVFIGVADEWIRNKRILSQNSPEQFDPEWVDKIEAAFERWKKGVEIPDEGNSVRACAFLSPSEIKRCISANVLTVEQLALLNEGGIDALGMGARAMKQKAVDWVTERNGAGHLIEELAAERQKRQESDAKVDELGELLRQTNARLEALESRRDEAPRRGRPPTVRPEADDGDALR